LELNDSLEVIKILLVIFQDHYAKYEPTILELKRKYELAMKEKMLMSIEKDKVAAKASPLHPI
jgi:hypothetical protein